MNSKLREAIKGVLDAELAFHMVQDDDDYDESLSKLFDKIGVLREQYFMVVQNPEYQ